MYIIMYDVYYFKQFPYCQSKFLLLISLHKCQNFTPPLLELQSQYAGSTDHNVLDVYQKIIVILLNMRSLCLVGIVCLRTKTTEFSFLVCLVMNITKQNISMHLKLYSEFILYNFLEDPLSVHSFILFFPIQYM
jgi:hypothetical protein